jgi:hypothetical protein
MIPAKKWKPTNGDMMKINVDATFDPRSMNTEV